MTLSQQDRDMIARLKIEGHKPYDEGKFDNGSVLRLLEIIKDAEIERLRKLLK
jgi:hypothetical protein